MPKPILYAIPVLVLVLGLLVYFGRIDYDRMPERITVASFEEALIQTEGYDTYFVVGRSMEPLIMSHGEGIISAIAVLEDKPFADLGIGDVVIYVGPNGKVIHMIASKHGDRYMLRGIGNERVDTYYLTEDMFIGRVSRVYVW